MWTFERFEAGAPVGQTIITVDDDWAQLGAALNPPTRSPDRSRVSVALGIALMMRGYTEILRERPPGNVHAGQQLQWGKPIRLGDAVVVSLRCLSKEFRNGRRWLTLENRAASAAGEMHVQGAMRMLWAR